MKDLKEKSYNPKNDPLMPRLFRKISHQNGERPFGSSHMSKGTRLPGVPNWTPKASHYDNNASLSHISKGEKYTLVNHPLRTKVNQPGGISKSLMQSQL